MLMTVSIVMCSSVARSLACGLRQCSRDSDVFECCSFAVCGFRQCSRDSDVFKCWPFASMIFLIVFSDCVQEMVMYSNVARSLACGLRQCSRDVQEIVMCSSVGPSLACGLGQCSRDSHPRTL